MEVEAGTLSPAVREEPGFAAGTTAARLLLLGLFALPLVINPVVALSFDEVFLAPKVLWVYAALLPAALLVLWRGRGGLAPFRGVLTLLGAWAGWLVLSTGLTGAGWPGWWGAADRADGVGMHLVYAVLLLAGLVWGRSGERAREEFGRAVLVGGALLALTNVLQQVGLLGVPGAGATAGVVATPYGGLLGNRGYLGGALALLLPLALVTAARHPRDVWRWLAAALIAWAWAGSFTRGVWLAGACGLVWLLLAARPRLSLRAWAPALLGVGLCVLTATARGEGRAFSLQTTVQPGQAAQPILDTSQRGVLWKSAVVGLRERPLLGWGTPALWRVMSTRPDGDLLAEAGTRDVARARRLGTDPTRAPSFVVTHGDGERELVTLPVNKVHNEYLDYALTYGLPAGVLFTALLAWAVWAGRWAVPGVSAGLVAYAAYLFTWPEVIRFAPLAWFMMGLALAAGVRRPGPQTASRAGGAV